MKTKIKREQIPYELYDRICLFYKDKYKKPEEWKDVIINNTKTNFRISNYGRLEKISGEELEYIYMSHKHFGLNILSDTGSNYIGIYRLVAMMFIAIPEKYIKDGYKMKDLVVDHIRDGDSDNLLDNTMWNLQWLTHRENISKAAKCGMREAFPKDFRDKLDERILSGYDNKELYDFCKKCYGYKKEDVKAMIQIRRRRLNKTLKPHYEHDKKYVEKIDKLLKKGLSNDEIINKLSMDTSTRESARLLQYRRSVLKIPTETSKYFTKEKNELVRNLIAKGLTNEEILNELGMTDISYDDKLKICATLRARRHQYKKSITSSTTREN